MAASTLSYPYAPQAHHYPYLAAPQPPPSPPVEATPKPSLPSISSLLTDLCGSVENAKRMCQSAIESEPRGEHHGGDKSVLGGWLKTPPSTTEALFDERVSPFSSSSSAYPTTSPLTSSASYRHHPPSTSSYNTAPHAFGSSSSSTAGVTNAGSLPQGRQNPVHWSSAHPVPSGSYRRYGSVNDSSAAAAAARYYPTPRSSIGSESSCRVSLSPARERAVLQQPKRDEPQPQAQLRLQQQQSQETWNQGERALPQYFPPSTSSSIQAIAVQAIAVPTITPFPPLRAGASATVVPSQGPPHGEQPHTTHYPHVPGPHPYEPQPQPPPQSQAASNPSFPLAPLSLQGHHHFIPSSSSSSFESYSSRMYHTSSLPLGPHHHGPSFPYHTSTSSAFGPFGPYPFSPSHAHPSQAQAQERYICPTCHKPFSRPSSLRIHGHSHSGEKPFVCGGGGGAGPPKGPGGTGAHDGGNGRGCGKRFSVRSNCRRHERGCRFSSSGGGAVKEAATSP